MIGLDLKSAKSMFFDTKAVMSRVDKATRAVLSKFGAFVRTRARSSIKKRKDSAPPGSPPSSHTGLLKRFIYFGFDPACRSVVIGPVRLAGKEGTAPATLEYGDTTFIKRLGRRVRARYKPRPYMHPAFRAELPGLPAMWSDSVRP